MEDIHGYEQGLKRYRQRWMQLAIVPWIAAWLSVLFLFVTGGWDVGIGVDLLSHALLLSPIFVWTLGRRELRGPVLAFARTQSTVQGYRTSPTGPTNREAWLITGPFPRWSLTLAGLYLLMDASLCAFASFGYVGVWIGVACIILARVFFFWWWFTRVRRDASRVGVLESRSPDSSTEFLIRCHDGPLLVSIARPGDDPTRLHVNVFGAVEQWTVVWSADDISAGRVLPDARGRRNARADSAQG